MAYGADRGESQFSGKRVIKGKEVRRYRDPGIVKNNLTAGVQRVKKSFLGIDVKWSKWGGRGKANSAQILISGFESETRVGAGWGK